MAPVTATPSWQWFSSRWANRCCPHLFSPPWRWPCPRSWRRATSPYCAISRRAWRLANASRHSRGLRTTATGAAGRQPPRRRRRTAGRLAATRPTSSMAAPPTSSSSPPRHRQDVRCSRSRATRPGSRARRSLALIRRGAWRASSSTPPPRAWLESLVAVLNSSPRRWTVRPSCWRPRWWAGRRPAST